MIFVIGCAVFALMMVIFDIPVKIIEDKSTEVRVLHANLFYRDYRFYVREAMWVSKSGCVISQRKMDVLRGTLHLPSLPSISTSIFTALGFVKPFSTKVNDYKGERANTKKRVDEAVRSVWRD